MMGPMTFIVLLVLLIAVIVGVAVIVRGTRQNREDLELGTKTPCPHCQKLNPTHAKFCGQCGEKY